MGTSDSYSDGGARTAAALLAYLLVVHLEGHSRGHGSRLWREPNRLTSAKRDRRADEAITAISGMIN